MFSDVKLVRISSLNERQVAAFALMKKKASSELGDITHLGMLLRSVERSLQLSLLSWTQEG